MLALICGSQISVQGQPTTTNTPPTTEKPTPTLEQRSGTEQKCQNQQPQIARAEHFDLSSQIENLNRTIADSGCGESAARTRTASHSSNETAA